MTTKQYLEQLRVFETKICQKSEELSMLRANAMCVDGIDYSLERVQSSLSGDQTGDMATNYVDLETMLNDEIRMLYSARHNIINQIQGIHIDNYIQILYKRYIQYKSFEKISDEMMLSYRYTIGMHGKALQEFGKKYKNLERILHNSM